MSSRLGKSLILHWVFVATLLSDVSSPLRTSLTTQDKLNRNGYGLGKRHLQKKSISRYCRRKITGKESALPDKRHEHMGESDTVNLRGRNRRSRHYVPRTGLNECSIPMVHLSRTFTIALRGYFYCVISYSGMPRVLDAIVGNIYKTQNDNR